MSHIYQDVCVEEASKILEAAPTYLYRLIRQGRIIPTATDPLQVSKASLISHVKRRVPAAFQIDWRV